MVSNPHFTVENTVRQSNRGIVFDFILFDFILFDFILFDFILFDFILFDFILFDSILFVFNLHGWNTPFLSQSLNSIS